MSKRYIYVEVRDVTEAADEQQVVSFDSVIVSAESEDDAYVGGSIAILEQRASALQDGGTMGSTVGDADHGKGRFLNDYVRVL